MIQERIVVRGRGVGSASARDESDQPASKRSRRRAWRSRPASVARSSRSSGGTLTRRALLATAASYHSAASYIALGTAKAVVQTEELYLMVTELGVSERGSQSGVIGLLFPG